MLAPATELPDEFRPLHRDEYDALVATGALEGTRVQLVGGLLIEMAPQHSPHIRCIQHLNMVLVPQVVGRHVVNVKLPLAVDDISVPEPDLAIIPQSRPVGRTSEALLVIEIADSSLRLDLGEKARRYAAAGYPEYWVVDVAARVLIRHLDPQPEGTWDTIERLEGGTIHPVAVEAVTVDLDDLLVR